MRLLVTGAAGLIGRHVAERFAPKHEVVALRHADLDITDREAVHRTVAAVRPALIVNAAVIEVDECERDPALARSINVDGPRWLAEAAAAARAEIVHFGTNYAFNGAEIGRAPYTIDDPPDPVNVYGRTKVEGEEAVRRECRQSYIVRTSWVFGPGKSVFLCSVHRKLRARQAVRAIADLWSSTTYVRDLVSRLEAVLAARRHGTYHIVNAGVCSYYEFAVEAARLVGLGPPEIARLVSGVKEADMARLAPRPRYTPLRCRLSEELGLPPLRHWREALAEYVVS
ncbi:MAG TPA: dTDP-4-dehydrorhamnose reductase [candidate division Zixibacteria bacterium]|nr:dTDP-4-dehydrorhamnose reductase [candidate division Zixibacteria bacterium]